jgi:maltose alpha-D-glucosyltransferase / alpha-amylase
VAANPVPIPDPDPLWYKDAVIYEVHARAFFDSDDDGMGDFRGLSAKLDYLQDLGVTVIWLLPFFPSPWRDDGYDISDYKDVHPAYGTLRDFQTFLKRAHRRGIRVITEIVLNHTSDQHPWFQHSRRAPAGSRWRDFYVWSDTAEKYKDARIIFQDFEASNWTWDPVAKAYYWHRFYSHQPDLNFDNLNVQKAVLDVIDFWMEMGVDGFRLDAVPYLFEREGTSCENLPETHQFLKYLRNYIDSKYKDRVIIAEANQWPEDAVAYFGADDECHMAFHFPVMTRLFMAIRMEDRFPVMEILQETPAIPPKSQWALFLRNHDELTLEMVTDEERDYMYRVYGHDRRMRLNLGIRRRLAPLLDNDRRKIELMNALLFSLPGTPVIYYGDEIGMGDNIYLGDRNGVRTPMQWSADRNAGFSRANPQKLYLSTIIDPEYHYEAVNVESQQNNPHSLLWWMKHLVEHRRQYKAFGRGTLEFLRPSNRKVLAFLRRYQDETVLVVANLSRFPQYVELDLHEGKGMTPVEIFGRTEFPPIGDSFYNLTLGALSFFWFSLESRQTNPESVVTSAGGALLPLVIVDSWDEVFRGRGLATLLRRMPAFLKTRRWFQGKNRSVRSVGIADDIPVPGTSAHILLGTVDYSDGDPETYVLPGSVALGDAGEQAKAKLPDVSVAELQAQDASKGVLYSAVWDPLFCDAVLSAIARRRRFRGEKGELTGSHTRAFRKIWGAHPELGPAVLKTEQSNTAIAYGDRFLLKLYRRVEPGIHPETEVGAFLTERNFQHTPALAGSIDYRPNGADPTVIAALFAFVENQGNAWNYTVDSIGRFFDAALARHDQDAVASGANEHPFDLVSTEPPVHAHELIGDYLDAAHLMGRRTAELHLALSSDFANADFAPEPFTDHYRLALQHSLTTLTSQVFQFLRFQLKNLPAVSQSDAQKLLDQQDRVRKYFRVISDRKLTSLRTRVHDDLHLSRLLHTGKDFTFIGFEGRAGRPLSERRIKRCPLRDVASMVMSLQFAADAVFFDQVHGVKPRPENSAVLESLSAYWFQWTSAAFLNGYFGVADGSSLFAQNNDNVRLLLDIFLMEQALDEIRIQLRDEPAYARTPIKLLQRVLDNAQ